MTVSLTPFADVLAAYARGEMVVILDHPDRENEGDLAVLTEKVSTEQVAFMMREGRGLICVSVSPERSEVLDLPLLARANTSHFGTPFAVSVDHISVASKGVTAESRALTMRSLVASSATPRDFVSPGHVFPLIAHPRGVLGRRGQTEGSYDLARLAGAAPSGVICEILDKDGNSARDEALRRFINEYRLPTTTVAEIARYRILHELPVCQVREGVLESRFGPLKISVFAEEATAKEHFTASLGTPGDCPLVRLHSECFTGDIVGSSRCDCGPQLNAALALMQQEGGGVLLYLRQEGRGIGLSNKVWAYTLQDLGEDTVDANTRLGFRPDERDFTIAARILAGIGIRRIRLLTNNPAKVAQLEEAGIEVVERVPLVVTPTPENSRYLSTKRGRLGHLL